MSNTACPSLLVRDDEDGADGGDEQPSVPVDNLGVGCSHAGRFLHLRAGGVLLVGKRCFLPPALHRIKEAPVENISSSCSEAYGFHGAVFHKR